MSYALVAILVPLAFLLSILIRERWVLPILTGLAVYFPFVLESQRSLYHGFMLLLFWTVLQSAMVLFWVMKRPVEAETLIWRSSEYSTAMFRWIETGALPEGNKVQVMRFHLKQTLLYCVMAFFSGNFLSLILGSALLNYMNYYVGNLTASSADRSLAIWLGWNPWSIVRVLTFLYLGQVFGAPFLYLLFPLGFSLSPMLLLPGLAGVAGDILLKVALSPSWSLRLRCNLLIQ